MNSIPLNKMRTILNRWETEARCLTGRLRDINLHRINELKDVMNSLTTQMLHGSDMSGMQAAYTDLLARIEMGFNTNRMEYERIIQSIHSRVRGSHETAPVGAAQTTLPAICPCFCGCYNVTRTRKTTAQGSDDVLMWAQVMENVLIPRDQEETDPSNDVLVQRMKDWVGASGCWKVSQCDVERTGWCIRAFCLFGGQALKYQKRIVKGTKVAANPNTRGFAKQDTRYENCPGEMRVHFSTRMVLSIEVKLRDLEGSVHTHGEPIPDVVITPALVKADPSLSALNALTEHARNISLPPGAVLGESLPKLRQTLGEDYDTVIHTLTRSDGKVDIQNHVAKVRGQKKIITIEYLERLRLEQERVYRSAANKRHVPRVIGLSHATEADGKLHFVLTISTDAMLDTAMTACLNGLVVATDCTFKRLSLGAVLTIGAVDRCGHYRFLSISLTSGETSRSYQDAFEHLKSAVLVHRGFDFVPRYLMGDASLCLNGVFRVLTDETKRVNCYSHFMKASHRYVKYTLRCSCWDQLRKYLRILANARSRKQFELWLRYLKERVGNEFPASVKNYLETSPYFDPDSPASHWYWCTSDGLEDAGKVRTNNANEGSNGRLRSQMFRNSIQSLSTGIGAMVSDQMAVLSHETDHICLEQRFDSWTKEWNLAGTQGPVATIELVASQYNFMKPGVACEGDTYAINCTSEDVGLLATGVYDPFDVDAPKGYLVYIPALERIPADLNASPLKNGPVCCCGAYAARLRCYHICLVLARYRSIDLSPNRTCISDRSGAIRTNIPRLPPRAALVTVGSIRPSVSRNVVSSVPPASQPTQDTVVTSHSAPGERSQGNEATGSAPPTESVRNEKVIGPATALLSKSRRKPTKKDSSERYFSSEAPVPSVNEASENGQRSQADEATGSVPASDSARNGKVVGPETELSSETRPGRKPTNMHRSERSVSAAAPVPSVNEAPENGQTLASADSVDSPDTDGSNGRERNDQELTPANPGTEHTSVSNPSDSSTGVNISTSHMTSPPKNKRKRVQRVMMNL